MSIDNKFRRGSKSSSAIMASEAPNQIEQFMSSSFYLPVDVLKNAAWKVYPIGVMTGAKFQNFYNFTKGDFHFVEDKELLFSANFVAMSARRNLATGKYFYVAKIWYGEAP